MLVVALALDIFHVAVYDIVIFIVIFVDIFVVFTLVSVVFQVVIVVDFGIFVPLFAMIFPQRQMSLSAERLNLFIHAAKVDVSG